MPRPKKKDLAAATRAVHHPAVDAPSAPLTAPLYQSSTFRDDRAAVLAEYSEQVEPPAYYTRWGNPTIDVLQRVIADLEGGEKCLATASGMAAVSTTLLGLLDTGDHVVAGQSLYTGTTKLLTADLPRLGIDVDLVDPTDLDALDGAIGEKTRLIYFETPTNPTLSLVDMAAVCDVARSRGVLTVMDNTFASPLNQQPLAAGVDVVIHSATKYLGGHSDVVAGCIVTNESLAETLWRRRTILGGSLDPFAAWLLLRGVKTLAVRVERQNDNAMAVARALEEHPQVSRVYYPGLPSHEQHELARRQMTGFGGMVSFDLTGGRTAGVRLVESTEQAVLAVSLGGVETLIEHPASMSHAPLTDEQLRTAGISPGLIRLSVGIEDSGDLIADLEQALDGLG